jgi:hypothetical protein
MDRREVLGVIGTGAATLAAMSGTASAQVASGARYRSQLDKMHTECLDHCEACSAVCNEASHHCLTQLQRGLGDREHHGRAHQLTDDCAVMCATSATLIARSSPFMADQCNACADACRRCAEQCDKDAEKASIMVECARICRECEKSCRAMVSAHGGATGGSR